ncbi:MAG: M1 family metallopeptidase, partial [Calditrichia bacterium]
MQKFTFLFLMLLPAIQYLAAQPANDIPKDNSLIREFESRHFAARTAFLDKQPTQNQSQYDVRFYDLQLELFPEFELLKGRVTITGQSLITGLTQVELDLYSPMTVDSVLAAGQPLAFTHDGLLLTVTLPAPAALNSLFSFTVVYQGNPETAYLGSWFWDEHQGESIIWSLSEPFGAPGWWPCKDDPADKADSVFMEVILPDSLLTVSNGLLKSEQSLTGGRKSYRWETRYPVSTYLVALTATNFSQFQDWYISTGGDSMPVDFYVYPEHLNAAIEDFNVTVPMMNFFATVFGEYPFLQEKYGLVEFPWGGAMEHQTITSYGSGLITGNHYYDYINVHELAHQWFGDAITMRSWSHIWLNEGFASYAEALWQEHLAGASAYQAYMAQLDPGSFTGSVYVADTTDINALFGQTVYYKGAWVLHMLRGVLGDADFFNALQTYANSPALQYGTAVTEDFRQICETVSGYDLSWFFDQWIYREGRPHYVFNWEVSGNQAPFTTTLTLHQLGGLYKMPLQIRLSGAGNNSVFTVWDSLEVQQFQFTTSFEPALLEVDPEQWVLKVLLPGDVYQVSGSILDAADSSGVSGSEIYWEGPYDPLTAIPYDFGFDTTDAAGNFQLSLATGGYALIGFKDGFLISNPIFTEIDDDTSGLELFLSEPQVTLAPDSFMVTLPQGQIWENEVTGINAGSGPALVQPVVGDYPALLQKRLLQNMTSSMIPWQTLKKQTGSSSSAAKSPSGWQHIFR